MDNSSREGPITFTKTDEGFLTISADEDFVEIQITMDLAKKIIDKSLILLEGQPRPFLFLYKNINVKLTNEVSRYIATHAELLKVKKAEAIVTSSLANRLIVNFFAYFFIPLAPVRVFKDEAAAREWLTQFL